MYACDGQFDVQRLFAVFNQIIRWVAELVISNVSCCKISISCRTVSRYRAFKFFGNFCYIVNVIINYKKAVLWYFMCEFRKRFTDIIYVLEEIKVVFFNIQNDSDCRKRDRKLLVYSHASVTNEGPFPTRIFPPIEWSIPPTEIVGSVFSFRRISVSMEVVVVFP